MCGPPDFEALSTCVTRIAALSAAGLTSYSICKTASLYRRLRSKRKERGAKALPAMPAILAAETLSGQPNT